MCAYMYVYACMYEVIIHVSSYVYVWVANVLLSNPRRSFAVHGDNSIDVLYICIYICIYVCIYIYI